MALYGLCLAPLAFAATGGTKASLVRSADSVSTNQESMHIQIRKDRTGVSGQGDTPNPLGELSGLVGAGASLCPYESLFDLGFVANSVCWKGTLHVPYHLYGHTLLRSSSAQCAY
jgi:hypothetical protein